MDRLSATRAPVRDTDAAHWYRGVAADCCCWSLPGARPNRGVRRSRTPRWFARVLQLMPARVAGRDGWAADIQMAFAAQAIVPTTQNLCAVLAVNQSSKGVKFI